MIHLFLLVFTCDIRDGFLVKKSCFMFSLDFRQFSLHRYPFSFSVMVKKSGFLYIYLVRGVFVKISRRQRNTRRGFGGDNETKEALYF